jgi:putative flippase GtrA
MNSLVSVKIIKFGVVGISGLLIDFSVTWLCKEKLKWNKYLSNSLGFSVAVCSNFFLNKYWTFNSLSTQSINQFLQFLLVAIIGLGINNMLLYLLTKKVKANFYFLKLLAIGVVFLWNYSMNFLFTFK